MKRIGFFLIASLLVSGGGMQISAQAVYDLRTLGLVTPVKDQGSCGSCWAFASLAAIESNWLKNGYGVYGLSEDNLTDCHQFDEGPCAGGSFYMTSALFSRHGGPLNQVDDPYTPLASNCPNGLPFPPGPPAYVEEIRFLPPDQTVIKQALVTYGAVASTMYFNPVNYSPSGFKYYDAVIDAADLAYPHGVTIVGWNDALSFSGAPGNGGWIIKDSYGTSWAQAGYLYVSYYDAGILTENAVFPSRQAIPPVVNRSHVYYNDAFGWVNNFGFGSNVGYALARYQLYPTNGVVIGQKILRVGTYAVAPNTLVEMELYRQKNGDVLNGLMGSASTLCPYSGFYTLSFNLPTDTLGTDVYIKVRYTASPAIQSPIPVEMYEASHTSGIYLSPPNAEWVSATGQVWLPAGQGSANQFDVCIKLYTEEAPKAIAGLIPDTVCVNVPVPLLDLTAQPKDSVAWLVNGQWLGNLPILNFIPSGPGSCTIRLVAYLGHHSDTLTKVVWVEGCVGIPVSPVQAFQVFPNPAEETLFVRFSDPGNKILYLFDIAGREIKVMEAAGAECYIDLSALPPGWYGLRIRQALNGQEACRAFFHL